MRFERTMTFVDLDFITGKDVFVLITDSNYIFVYKGQTMIEQLHNVQPHLI